jgi:hypothetical protein
MSQSAVESVNLGFLAVQREPAGYVGGYLVTNLWGRPLEFRLSSPVLPNKLQQILYGPALEPYLCGDLIGKKLLEKTTTPAQYIFTDQPAALDLRLVVDVPVGLFACVSRPEESSSVTDNVCCHPRFEKDVAAVRSLLDRLGPSFDLADPFQRIREALAEARKLGVANRAA